MSPANSPRSYLVDTPTGTIRRNRQHLNVAPTQPSESTRTQTETEQSTDSETTRRIVTRSQTGTVAALCLKGEMWHKTLLTIVLLYMVLV